MTFPFNAVNFMLLFTFGRLHHMLELFFCHDFTVVNYCSLWGEWEREEGREKEVQQDFFFPSQSILVITWIIPDFNDLSNKCMPTQSLLILHFQDDMCRAPWRPHHCWPLVPSWLLGFVCSAPDFWEKELFSVSSITGALWKWDFRHLLVEKNYQAQSKNLEILLHYLCL